jgi:chromosome segregation ATPase
MEPKIIYLTRAGESEPYHRTTSDVIEAVTTYRGEEWAALCTKNMNAATTIQALRRQLTETQEAMARLRGEYERLDRVASDLARGVDYYRNALERLEAERQAAE